MPYQKESRGLSSPGQENLSLQKESLIKWVAECGFRLVGLHMKGFPKGKRFPASRNLLNSGEPGPFQSQQGSPGLEHQNKGTPATLSKDLIVYLHWCQLKQLPFLTPEVYRNIPRCSGLLLQGLLRCACFWCGWLGCTCSVLHALQSRPMHLLCDLCDPSGDGRFAWYFNCHLTTLKPSCLPDNLNVCRCPIC